MTFKRELTFDEELDEFIVKATEWVSGWIETQSVVTHQSLIHYTVSYYPSITTPNCKAILEKLAGMNCLRPLVETKRRRVVQYEPIKRELFHRKLSKLRIKNCITEIGERKATFFKREDVVEEMIKKFSGVAMELIFDLLKLLTLEGFIVAKNSRLTEFEFPGNIQFFFFFKINKQLITVYVFTNKLLIIYFKVNAVVSSKKRSSSSRTEREIEPLHQPAKRRNRQTPKASTALPSTTTTATTTATTTPTTTLPVPPLVEIIVIDDEEEYGKVDDALPSSSTVEVIELDQEEAEANQIEEEVMLVPTTTTTTSSSTTYASQASSSTITTTNSSSSSSGTAFFSPAPTTTTAAAAVVTIMPTTPSSSTTTTTTTTTATSFNLDDLFQILVAAFARSKGEVPVKEVLLTAREQWPALSQAALAQLVSKAEGMNRVMAFEDRIYEI